MSDLSYETKPTRLPDHSATLRMPTLSKSPQKPSALPQPSKIATQNMLKAYGASGTEADVAALLAGSAQNRKVDVKMLEPTNPPRAAKMQTGIMPKTAITSAKKKRKPEQPSPLTRRPTLRARASAVNPAHLTGASNFDAIAKLVAIIDDQKLQLAKLAEDQKTGRIVKQRQDKAIQQMTKAQGDFPRLVASLNEEIRALKAERALDKKKMATISHNAQSQAEENFRIRSLLSNPQSQYLAKGPVKKTSETNEDERLIRELNEQLVRKDAEIAALEAAVVSAKAQTQSAALQESVEELEIKAEPSVLSSLASQHGIAETIPSLPTDRHRATFLLSRSFKPEDKSAYHSDAAVSPAQARPMEAPNEAIEEPTASAEKADVVIEEERLTEDILALAAYPTIATPPTRLSPLPHFSEANDDEQKNIHETSDDVTESKVHDTSMDNDAAYDDAFESPSENEDETSSLGGGFAADGDYDDGGSEDEVLGAEGIEEEEYEDDEQEDFASGAPTKRELAFLRRMGVELAPASMVSEDEESVAHADAEDENVHRDEERVGVRALEREVDRVGSSTIHKPNLFAMPVEAESKLDLGETHRGDAIPYESGLVESTSTSPRESVLPGDSPFETAPEDSESGSRPASARSLDEQEGDGNATPPLIALAYEETLRRMQTASAESLGRPSKDLVSAAPDDEAATVKPTHKLSFLSNVPPVAPVKTSEGLRSPGVPAGTTAGVGAESKLGTSAAVPLWLRR
ncbi:hypothetical protein HKX48_008104 [Thoreauomyces humboldtii]|nr:hypothetical protein HKX48_008104 [Thoreauomyces humboldtii]